MKAGDHIIVSAGQEAQIYGTVTLVDDNKIVIDVINGAWTMTIEVTKLRGNYNTVLNKINDARKAER